MSSVRPFPPPTSRLWLGGRGTKANSPLLSRAGGPPPQGDADPGILHAPRVSPQTPRGRRAEHSIPGPSASVQVDVELTPGANFGGGGC